MIKFFLIREIRAEKTKTVVMTRKEERQGFRELVYMGNETSPSRTGYPLGIELTDTSAFLFL